MEIHRLIEQINQQNATCFTLTERCEAGYQGGAHVLTDAAGQNAILKLGLGAQAAPIVSRLRELGYPTPAYQYMGSSLDGINNGIDYVVQDFMSGSPLTNLTEAILKELLQAIALQGEQAISTERNWSTYAYNVVFNDESGWANKLRNYSAETAELLSKLEAITMPYINAELPNGDIVHGDVDYDNILIHNGALSGIVDTAAAGCGTRTIDLMTVLQGVYYYDSDIEGIFKGRIYQAIVDAAEPATYMICLAYRIMAMVSWSIQHHSSDSVRFYVRHSWDMVDKFMSDKCK
ncbi:MAG: phosphotransferase [Chloroflexota bacterium]